MTDYTKLFRTLSIPQMQQVLAALCAYAMDHDVGGHTTKERVDAILSQAPSFNIDPADEAFARSQKATPMADTCPDCGRKLATGRESSLTSEVCDNWTHQGRRGCEHRSIVRLRARVAELEQAHAEQVAERQHLEEAARLLSSSQCVFLENWDEHHAWLEAERARQAKGDKREGSG